MHDTHTCRLNLLLDRASWRGGDVGGGHVGSGPTSFPFRMSLINMYRYVDHTRQYEDNNITNGSIVTTSLEGLQEWFIALCFHLTNALYSTAPSDFRGWTHGQCRGRTGCLHAKALDACSASNKPPPRQSLLARWRCHRMSP